MNNQHRIRKLEHGWASDRRWLGIKRAYRAEAVIRLRGSIDIKYTLAEAGATRLWELLHTEPYVPALGAMTGCQAVQQVQAGLKAIYLSGWQVAADANLAGQMYPDQSLYPANSVPDVVRKVNQALQRADQIYHAEGRNGVYWFAPIVADAAAGFGGNLNAFELMKAMIEAGATAVPFRRSARLGQEMWPYGGEGPGAHAGVYPETNRRTAGSRRNGSAYNSDRAHRRERRGPDHERRRRV
jgi:isocitrate lyase